MLPAHQLQGELAIPVPRYRHRAADEVRGRVHELLQSPARSRAWLAVLTTCRPTTSWRGPGSGG
jgi:hypothetical protein